MGFHCSGFFRKKRDPVDPPSPTPKELGNSLVAKRDFVPALPDEKGVSLINSENGENSSNLIDHGKNKVTPTARRMSVDPDDSICKDSFSPDLLKISSSITKESDMQVAADSDISSIISDRNHITDSNLMDSRENQLKVLSNQPSVPFSDEIRTPCSEEAPAVLHPSCRRRLSISMAPSPTSDESRRNKVTFAGEVTAYNGISDNESSLEVINNFDQKSLPGNNNIDPLSLAIASNGARGRSVMSRSRLETLSVRSPPKYRSSTPKKDDDTSSKVQNSLRILPNESYAHMLPTTASLSRATAVDEEFFEPVLSVVGSPSPSPFIFRRTASAHRSRGVLPTPSTLFHPSVQSNAPKSYIDTDSISPSSIAKEGLTSHDSFRNQLVRSAKLDRSRITPSTVMVSSESVKTAPLRALSAGRSLQAKSIPKISEKSSLLTPTAASQKRTELSKEQRDAIVRDSIRNPSHFHSSRPSNYHRFLLSRPSIPSSSHAAALSTTGVASDDLSVSRNFVIRSRSTRNVKVDDDNISFSRSERSHQSLSHSVRSLSSNNSRSRRHNHHDIPMDFAYPMINVDEGPGMVSSHFQHNPLGRKAHYDNFGQHHSTESLDQTMKSFKMSGFRNIDEAIPRSQLPVSLVGPRLKEPRSPPPAPWPLTVSPRESNPLAVEPVKIPYTSNQRRKKTRRGIIDVDNFDPEASSSSDSETDFMEPHARAERRVALARSLSNSRSLRRNGPHHETAAASSQTADLATLSGSRHSPSEGLAPFLSPRNVGSGHLSRKAAVETAPFRTRRVSLSHAIIELRAKVALKPSESPNSDGNVVLESLNLADVPSDAAVHNSEMDASNTSHTRQRGVSGRNVEVTDVVTPSRKTIWAQQLDDYAAKIQQELGLSSTSFSSSSVLKEGKSTELNGVAVPNSESSNNLVSFNSVDTERSELLTKPSSLLSEASRSPLQSLEKAKKSTPNDLSSLLDALENDMHVLVSKISPLRPIPPPPVYQGPRLDDFDESTRNITVNAPESSGSTEAAKKEGEVDRNNDMYVDPLQHESVLHEAGQLALADRLLADDRAVKDTVRRRELSLGRGLYRRTEQERRRSLLRKVPGLSDGLEGPDDIDPRLLNEEKSDVVTHPLASDEYPRIVIQKTTHSSKLKKKQVKPRGAAKSKHAARPLKEELVIDVDDLNDRTISPNHSDDLIIDTDTAYSNSHLQSYGISPSRLNNSKKETSFDNPMLTSRQLKNVDSLKDVERSILKVKH